MARYANILNDDAFKVIIFTPGNEELMARMLEVLLPGKTIRSLEFRPTEQHGLAISDKISNIDAVCTSDTGEMFIVEMQGLPQNSYADRMLCYASFPIRMQLGQKLKDLKPAVCLPGAGKAGGEAGSGWQMPERDRTTGLQPEVHARAR